MDDVRTVEAVISGHVQGVGYRDWTSRDARKIGLSGHVRNRPDGTVEALFCGAPDAVARMLESCLGGPLNARVTGIAVRELPAGDPDGGFRVLKD